MLPALSAPVESFFLSRLERVTRDTCFACRWARVGFYGPHASLWNVTNAVSAWLQTSERLGRDHVC